MPNRPDITLTLSKLLEDYIDPHKDSRIYWAKEVTFDYDTAHSIRVDYMRFKPGNNTVSGIEKGDFYCYEIKSSVEDFRSKNGHNFIGDYNYYVMPRDVFESVKDEVPYRVGVFCPDNYGWLKSVKKAHRINRVKPMCEMLLMMYRSARRDIKKMDLEEEK